MVQQGPVCSTPRHISRHLEHLLTQIGSLSHFLCRGPVAAWLSASYPDCSPVIQSSCLPCSTALSHTTCPVKRSLCRAPFPLQTQSNFQAFGASAHLNQQPTLPNHSCADTVGKQGPIQPKPRQISRQREHQFICITSQSCPTLPVQRLWCSRALSTPWPGRSPSTCSIHSP